ncbi:MAG TPA: AMIN domain-containing protein [Syntrophobacteria bacterium]|nr:AMIN domain-containing protein [Syntrophobacteria bacterium]
MLRRRSMLKVGCVTLIVFVLTALDGAALHAAGNDAKPVAKESPSPSPAALKEIRVVYQEGLWHVVLTGSQPMTYRALKVGDPLRVLVDLPNTSNGLQSPLTVNNEVISTVKAAAVVTEPEPLTRVEIGLNRDTSFRIKGVGEKVWVSLGATAPVPPAATPLQVEPLKTVERGKIQPPEPKRPEITLPPTSSAVPTVPFTPPAQTKRKTMATKILAIEPVATSQELKVYVRGNGSLGRYNAFHLSGPPRVVVDFLDVHSTQTTDSVTLTGALVKQVRVGRHGDKVRLVFDVIPVSGIPYQITEGADRLVVSFKPGPGFSSR